MKCSTSYHVTPELQDASVRQYFFTVLLRPRLGAFLFLIPAMTVLVVISPAYKMVLAALFSGLFIALAALWVKSYFLSLKMARDGLTIMEHPRVDLNFDHEQIEYASSTGLRVHRWEKVERVVETKDFVVLMHGAMALLSLPKSCLTPEVLAFLRDKMARNPSPKKAPRAVLVIAALLLAVLILLGALLMFLWIQM